MAVRLRDFEGVGKRPVTIMFVVVLIDPSWR